MLLFKRRYKVLITDIAGTICDKYSMAPYHAFKSSFNDHDIDITDEEIRRYMGFRKQDHIAKVLNIRNIDDKALELEIYKTYKEEQMRIMYEQKYSTLFPEAKYMLETLRKNGIKIGITTGYTRELVEPLLKSFETQNFVPDYVVTSDEVYNGRPEPDAIQKILKYFNEFPEQTIKIGDTVADIQEGINAGCTSVGVISTSSLFMQYGQSEKATRKTMYDIGANHVIYKFSDMML